MRFRLLLFLFFLPGLTNSYGQQRSRFIAGLGAGITFPLGTYGSQSVTDTSAGWASPGICLNLSATWQVSKVFGITLVAGGQENRQSESAFKESLRKSFSGVTMLQATTKSWQTGKLMAGGSLRLPLAHSEKTLLLAGAMAGICKTHMPGYLYTVTYTNDNSLPGAAQGTFSGQSLPWTFCYNIRSGLAFRLGNGLYLTGTLSYFGSQFEVQRHGSNIIYGTTGTGEINTQPPKKQPLSSLNAEAGLEISL